MANYYLSPISSIFQYFNDQGIILSGGKINTYAGGTSTPIATYTDITGATPNSNPIILAANGRLNNVQIWQLGGTTLKIIVTDSNNNQLGPVFDQMSGINDPVSTLAILANASSGSGVDLVANSVRSYDIVSSVRSANVPSLSAGQTLIILVEGSSTPGDGGGGEFYWNASSTATDDGVTVIKPNGLSGSQAGRYLIYTSGRGTFTGTLTGMTATTTGTVTYRVSNQSLVTMSVGVNAITGTSNANTMTMTGIPTQLLPATATSTVPCIIEDNTNPNLIGWISINSVNMTFYLGANPNIFGFTTSGTKGIPAGWTVTYALL